MSWIIDQNLDPTLQDWGVAYKELCAIIKAKVPEVKHIDLYYGQDQVVDQDGSWIPYKAPAVFLQFDAAKVDDLGDNTQQLTMDITMYLSVETVQDTNHGSAGQRRALEFVALLRKLHMQMHGASGDHFSPLSRVGLQKKADAPPYMYMYAQTYRCVLLDNSTNKQYNFAAAGSLGLEIEPYTAPPEDTLVVVRNSDGTYRVELEAPVDHVLPDVTHTDSDGQPAVRPAMTAFVATPCVAPLPVTVRNSTNSYTRQVDSGDSLELPDITHTDSNGQPVVRPAMVPFVATLCPVPPPGIARLRQTGGAQIGGDIPVASGAIVPITAPNGSVSIRNSQNAEVAQAFPMSGQSIIASVPDGSAVILDSTDVPIGSPLAVPSAAAPTRTIADSQITRPDGTIVGLRATQPLDVRSYRSGIRYAVNFGMWSGTEAVYQTGDEGAMYASGFFDYLGPLYPLHTARLVDWFTLFQPNVFGNTNRFTDRAGAQVYPNRIIVDHYTGLEWYSPTTALNGTWTAAISAGVALNYQGNTDWRVPPLGVLQTIIRNVTGVLLNYAPFSIPAGTIWTSTTNVSSTTNAIPMIASGAFQSTAKSGSARYFFVRRWAA